MNKLLEVKNLKTSFKTHIGDVQSVRGVSFHLNKGEALGIVGESGCGKSVTMMTIMRLLGENAKIEVETIKFNDKDLTNPNEKLMQTIRGNDMSMIFQDPMTSLNPLFTIGRGGWSVISTQKDAADREFIIWYGLMTGWIQ